MSVACIYLQVAWLKIHYSPREIYLALLRAKFKLGSRVLEGRKTYVQWSHLEVFHVFFK